MIAAITINVMIMTSKLSVTVTTNTASSDDIPEKLKLT